MWILTTSGFLSVVRHHDRPGDLLVRGRVRADLEAFCADTGADAPLETLGRDYRWRTVVPVAMFAQYLASEAEAIDYCNFKNAVAVRQGHDRALRYHGVWDVTHALQCDALRDDRTMLAP
jgi:hypothetical protein